MKYELAYSTWGNEEIDALQEVIRSGRYTMGPKVAEFEKKFAEKFDSKYAVMVGSGSAANLVAMAALSYKKDNPLQPGDEVIVPCVSWATTYYPLQQYGLKLKFIDIELETLNMDVSKLEEALTPKTKMVVGVSILGNPAALDVMRAFCDKHNLYFFEDNCESMGAELGGKKCGTFGDIGTFSTFFSHHICTMEGGFIVTDSEELYHLSRSMRAHGWTRDVPEGSPIYEQKDDSFFEAYRFIYPGYNARPIEMAGAVGLEQIKKLDGMVEQRRKNAELFQELFKNDPRFVIQKEHGKSSWFSFTFILNPELDLDRERVRKALLDAQIDFRLITGGNFLQHDVIKYFDYETVGEIKNAYTAHNRGFFVGNGPIDLTSQIKHLRDVLDKCVPR